MQAQFGSGTRWTTLLDTVDSVVAANEDKINFGAKWFPSSTGSCLPNQCAVSSSFDVVPAPNNHATMMPILNGISEPNIYCLTPTPAAWTETRDALDSMFPGEANALMLVIDGAIHSACEPPTHTQLVNAIEAEAPDMATYVVGIGTAGESASNANQYAIAGGARQEDASCFTQGTVNIPAGTASITFQYSKNANGSAGADYVWIDDIQLSGGATFSDDFESGDFSAGSYTLGGDVPWVVDRSAPFSGEFSARTGTLTHDQSSELTLTVNAASPATLTYRRRTETEANIDYLRILADGATLDFASGTSACPPFYFETTDPAQLDAAMNDIATSVIPCDVELGNPPPFGDEVDVKIAGVQYLRLDSTTPGFDCEDETGWHYTDELGTTCDTDIPFACDKITLCGAACDAFKAMTTPTADITYFCEAG
jgi:hypothetical protein